MPDMEEEDEEEQKEDEENWAYKDTYQGIISEDITKVTEALQWLSTELTFANRFRDMRPFKFIEPLLTCLTKVEHPNILQLASNCLLNLVDIEPEMA